MHPFFVQIPVYLWKEINNNVAVEKVGGGWEEGGGGRGSCNNPNRSVREMAVAKINKFS